VITILQKRKTHKLRRLVIGIIIIAALFTTMFSGCVQQQSGLVIVPVGRDSASGTREFFWEHIMGKENFTTNMLEKNSNGAVLQTVSQTEGAIGYVGLGYVNKTEVKPLTVDGIEPTVANVLAGTYPIARDLNMFTNGNPTGVAAEFLNYLDSDEGQTIVEEEGFVPQTATGPYQKVEELTGSITIVGSTTVLPIVQHAAENFNALYGTDLVAVSGGGSGVGIQSVGEGSATIGMASRELKSTETSKYPALVKHVICKDGIALIVNLENTYVDDLTLAQIKAVYNGTYTNWDQL